MTDRCIIPYRRPFWLCNAHLETIWPSLFRKLPLPAYERERIETDDDDFIDLDWLGRGRSRLAIISHGLEGDSRRAYVIGMARALSERGRDVLAWNFRGCSGEVNRQPRFTHNGSTDDLHRVVMHAVDKGYREIALIGFSMGGNLTLMYLGREASLVPDRITKAIVFSVPCELGAASMRLAAPSNILYMKRFMRLMGEKVRAHAENHPESFPVEGYHRMTSFADFDGRYTAPLHGFVDAQDYWEQSSSRQYLSRINIPTWMINAQNDPFLPPECYPVSECNDNSVLNLLTPSHGGHCGFARSGAIYWSELLAARILA